MTPAKPRFCHVCGAELLQDRRMCMRCQTPQDRHVRTTPPRGISFETLAEGTLIAERYRIEAAESATRMHVLYRAHDTTLERTVMLRVLRKKGPSWRDAARQQARLGNALRHPAIIHVLDFVEDDRNGVCALVEEYAGTRTLRDWLRERDTITLPCAIYRELMLPMTSAIAHAHRYGVVHRNLKPSRVILDRYDRPKVADYGLGLYTRPEDTKGFPGIVGTLEYLAPEHAQNPKTSEASGDIYALGVLFYEIVSGELPLRGENDLDLLNKLLHDKPQPLNDHVREIMPGLDAVIMHCLEKDPRARPPSADALYVDLANTLGVGAHG